MVQNKRVIYASHPTGFPVAGKDLILKVEELDLPAALPKGGVITKNHYVSLDPYQRGRMRSPEVKSYVPPYRLHEPITNDGVGQIVLSDSPEFKPGEWCVGRVGFEEYSVLKADAVKGLQKLHNPHNLPLSYFLGILGMPGLTA